jgi:carboxypeptidase family protein
MRIIALLSLTLAAPLSAALTGSVVTAEGTPLTHVRVEAFRPVAYMNLFEQGGKPPVATAVTDDSGQFSLDLNGTGLIDLRVLVDGYVPAFKTALIDEPAGAIVLKRGSAVEGTVMSNGKPVSGAKVWFARTQGAAVVLTSDAQGKYRITDPQLWAQAIVVTHPDFAPASHPANMPNFSLDAGRELRGTVVDASDRPVGSASVSVDEVLFTTTDAAGKFVVPHAPQRPALVMARTKSGVGFTPAAAGAPVIRLRPASHISGVVRGEGNRPLSGIMVAVGSEAFPAMAVTDADGKFAVDVPRGKYELVAGEMDGSYTSDPIAIDAGEGDVRRDVVVKRLPFVSIVVRTQGGKPVAGAGIHLLYGRSQMVTGAVTLPDGSARMPQPQLDGNMSLRIVAVKAGLPPAVSEPISDWSRTKSVDITIPDGVAVSGTVVDKDKKPVSGVEVEPVFGAAIGEGTIESAAPHNADPWATTDSEGRFSGRLSSTTNGLAFTKKGYVRLRQPIEITNEPKSVQAQLAAASSISGRVVNKDGSPAAEITVFVGNQMAVSGADGSFELSEVEAGPQLVRFGKKGFQQQAVTAPANNIVLKLPAMRTLHGRVIDAATGEPVKKFIANVETPSEEFDVPTPTESETGEFNTEAPQEAVTLSVTAQGYVAATKIAVAADKSDPIVVRLLRGRTLRGHVVDEKQQPLAGVAYSGGGDDSFAYHNDDVAGPPQTGADGSFEITGIGNDEQVRVTFQKEGYVDMDWRGRLRPDDAPIQIVMRRGLKVTGRVVDASGAGVPEISVEAASPAIGAAMTSQMTNESGVFEFDALAPGRYDFTAIPMQRAQRGALHDVDIEKVHELKIVLESRPSGTIFGHVTGLDASANAAVTATGADSADTQSAPVDLSGNFRIENAPVGPIEVEASVYSHRVSHHTKRVALDLAAGAETRVDLAFPQTFNVHGRVTRGGTPLAAANVSFYGSGSADAMTGPDGAYEITLDAGEYDVALSSADRKKVPFSKHVSINDSSELNLNVDSATVSAVVTDAETEQPIAGAQVSASVHGQTHSLTDAMTASDGVASLDVSRGETLTITASHAGYGNAGQDITPADNQSIALRLKRTPGAVVRIVDVRDGRTLSGYVIARDSSGRVVASAYEPDPDGTVTLPILPGPYSISASAEGFGSQTVKAEVPSTEIRVPLPRGGSLSLRSQNDVHGTARLIQPNGEEYVRCWCNGVAEIKIDGPSTLVDRISPGSYTLEISRSDGKTKRIPVSIIQDQITTVSID